MKKIIFLFFIVISSLSFGELKDNISLFSEENASTINSTIEKIEKDKKVKVYINTVVGEESFQLANPQKTCIITYQKVAKDIIITELKFTEDLKMGEKSQEIDLILDSLKDKLFEKDYLSYTLSLLEYIDSLIALEEKEEEEEGNFPEDSVVTKKGFLRRIFSKNP